MQADASASGDDDIAIVQRVAELGQAAVRSWRGGIQLVRRFHGQRFVRPFGVEFSYEGIEAGLLLEALMPGGSGRLLFQRQVHALMTAALGGDMGGIWLRPLFSRR